jgi:hypothetical protein
MLEIIIYKSQGGRSLVKQFSNSYLFNGAPNYISDAALAVANSLAVAESRIYFDDTSFMRLVIRQLDAQGNHIDGETRTSALNMVGANTLDPGSKIVPPNIVLAYEKKVLVGRAGVTLYRNAISTDEYNLYLETGAVPPRLNTSFAPGTLPEAFFSSALLGVEGATGLDMMLPLNSRYSNGAVRPITSIAFAGVRFRQETFDRESGLENLGEAVQQLINENGRAMRRLVRQLAAAAGPVLTALGAAIVGLVLEAMGRYALLSIAQKAGIVFPAIYQAAEVLALMAGAVV